MFIESVQTLLRREPLVYVDAGARGDLEGGWRTFPEGCLAVLAFEPDPEAPIDWDEKDPLRHLERSALWSEETELKVHIGRIPSTSSVWPPNMEYLQRFEERFVSPRQTLSIVQVKAKTLDAVVAYRKLAPDFLKIDTQGAELQILQGSRHALQEAVLGAVVETWTVPVHKGQGLTHEVMELMHEEGFVIGQVETAAAWERRAAAARVDTRRQIVGLDILFLKDPKLIEQRFRSAICAAKYAVIAHMYGLDDLALEALEMGIAQAAKDDAPLLAARSALLELHSVRKQATSSPKDFLQRLRNRFRAQPTSDVTKLHY